MPAASAAAIYALITAAMFHNLLPVLGTHLYSDLGDTLLNTSILAWNAAHLPLSPEWWNFPSFAPLSGVTAFTEHLLAAYPVASPIVWATGNPILAYNVVLLLTFPLNGTAAYLLARELTGSPTAALVGGLAFAFAPYHSFHVSHLQMLMAFGMPLGLLGLHRYLRLQTSGAWLQDRRSSIGALLLFGVGWFIAALSNAYMLVFFPILVALWCVWFIRPAEWRRVVPPFVAAVTASLPLVPLLAGYRTRQAAYELFRQPSEIRSFSADMVGLLGISHRELLWQGILPASFQEGTLFPGLAIVALAVMGVAARLPRGGQAIWPRRLFIVAGVVTLVVLARVWAGPFGWRIGPLPLPPFTPFRVFTGAAAALLIGVLLTPRFRDAWARRDPIVFYAVAAVVLWLFALGPQPDWSGAWRGLVYGPYWLLMHLPGAQSIRVPARAWLPAVLCLSVLAAAGASVLRQRRRTTLLAIAVVAIVAEAWFFDEVIRAPAPMPPGTVPQRAVVLDLPIDEGYWNAVPQYRAVRGGYRAINGYSGYEPAHFLPLRRAIADLRVDALNPFRAVTEVHVIVRPGTPAAVAAWVADHPGAARVSATADAIVYRLPRLDPTQPRVPMPLPLPRHGAGFFGLN